MSVSSKGRSNVQVRLAFHPSETLPAGAVYTATTISFSSAGTISDSANGLASFATGDRVEISGSASNDKVVTITSGGAAGSFSVSETLITEAAGALVTLRANGPPRTAGFMLATDEKGTPLFSAVDDAPRLTVQRVREAGFEIDEQTLEMTFLKSAWDGPFGAYEEMPGQNRPALTEGVDCRCQRPCLWANKYTMGYKTYTASVTFAATVPGTITDAANGLAEFKGGEIMFPAGASGDRINISGTTNNNGTYDISTGSVAGTLRTVQPTVAEGPVTATITVINSTAVSYPTVFANKTYIISGRLVFKVANWGTPGSSYLVSVFRHSVAAIFGTMHVHNGYLYACAGTSGAYAYTADGTTWVESNRGGTDQQATEMITLRGILHKSLGNNHYQLLVATDTGINGGTTWGSADQIGDTSYGVGRMMVLNDNLVFSVLNGLVNLDGEGNINSLLPGLETSFGLSNSGATRPWLNNAIIVPMYDGSVKIYQEGMVLPASPFASVERSLEITQIANPPLTEDLFSTAGIGNFVFANQFDPDDDMRLIVLEQTGQSSFLWRSLFKTTEVTVYTSIWATYVTDSGGAGPVLWIGYTNTAQPIHYWIVPMGNDATQDSRSRYGSSGSIYDPWLTFGIPDIQKRWSYAKVAVTQSTPANYAKTTYTLDAFNEAGSDVVTNNTLTMAQGITIGVVNFDANTVSRRARLVHTLGNTGANQELETPIVLWAEVHAFALPTPRMVFDMTLDVRSGAVGRGTLSQKEARDFLSHIPRAQLPMTLTDPDGTTWTVNRTVSNPQTTIVDSDNQRYSQVAKLMLQEHPVGS